MRSVKSLDFKSPEDHRTWIVNNRRTGKREIGCNEENGIVKIEYIELF